MERKTIVFTVAVSVEHESEHSWQKGVREIRKILKETIGNVPQLKVLKIDTKEG
jgi:hypothetical protein